MKVFNIYSLVICCYLSLYTSMSMASWVGAFLFSEPSCIKIDHIHLSVSSDSNITKAYRLNAWDGRAYKARMFLDMEEAEKFILFHSDISSQTIIKDWNKYVLENEDDFSIFSKNCAFSTENLLVNSLNLNLQCNFSMARFIGKIWIPGSLSLIPLPRKTYYSLKAALIKDKIPFKTKKHFLKSQLNANAFLKSIELEAM